MPINCPPGGLKTTSTCLAVDYQSGHKLDRVPSLALWLLSYCKNTATKTLKGLDLNCMICEQPVCDYWANVRASGFRPTLPLPTKSDPPDTPADKEYTFVYPGIPHTCSTLVGHCEHNIRIESYGCGHCAGYACLQKWIIAGHNWCRFCGTEWFRKEPGRTSRRAILKECMPIGRAMILVTGITENEEDDEPGPEDGAVGKGMWKDIYSREMERLAQARFVADTESIKAQVLRMDPSSGRAKV